MGRIGCLSMQPATPTTYEIPRHEPGKREEQNAKRNGKNEGHIIGCAEKDTVSYIL